MFNVTDSSMIAHQLFYFLTKLSIPASYSVKYVGNNIRFLELIEQQMMIITRMYRKCSWHVVELDKISSL